MKVVFRINMDGTVSIAKKKLFGKYKELEFETVSKNIPFSKFLEGLDNDSYREYMKNVLEEVSLYSEIKETFDGVIAVGPRVMRDIDYSYEFDCFVIGDKKWEMIKYASLSKKDKEKLIDEIIDYGVSLFGEEFKELVESKKWLDIDYMHRSGNLVVSDPCKKDYMCVYFKDGKMLPQEQQEKLKHLRSVELHRGFDFEKRVKNATSTLIGQSSYELMDYSRGGSYEEWKKNSETLEKVGISKNPQSSKR